MPLVAMLLLLSAGFARAQTYVFASASASSNVFPFATTGASNDIEWLYQSGDFAPTPTAGNITDIYLKASTSTTSATTYSNLTIKMGNTPLSSFTTGPYVTGLTTVFTSASYSITAVAGSYVHFTLQTPFPYTGGNFIVEISQTAYTGSGFYLDQDGVLSNRRMYGGATTGTAGTGLVHFAYDLAPNVPCTGQPNKPTITTPAITTAICAGTTATLTATNPNTSVTGINFQWQQATTSTGPWSNVTGGVGATTLSYTTPALTATTWYRVKAICSVSTLDSPSAAFQVPVLNPLVTATTPGSRCATGTVTLGATGNGTSLNWYAAATGGTSIGSGSVFTTPSISATTTYYVTAVNGACESTPRVAVIATVNTPPVATITPATSPSFCTGSVVLNANTGTGFTYQWQLNGLNITGATAASYTASSSGSYSVAVTNSFGCTTTSSAQTVQSGVPPSSSISPIGSIGICPGSSTTLSAPAYAGVTYQWNQNGNPISGATSSTYTVTTAGNYTVSASTGVGCTGTTTVPTTVFLNTLPAATITAPGSFICQGSNTILSANSGSGLGYQWMLNGNTITGATGASYAATLAGSYTVVVTNISTGCNATSAATALTIAPVPTATTIPSAPATGCDSIALTANTGTGYTYQWQQNGVNLPGANSVTYSAISNGNYTVVVTSNNCATVSAPVTVTVNPSPISVITYSSPTTFCQGSAVVLNSYYSAGNTYQWRMNGAPIPGATSYTTVASQPGNYTVAIVGTGGCTGLSAPVAVAVNQKPAASITNNNGNLSTGTFVSYQWYMNNQPVPGAMSQTFATNNQTGIYAVAVTDNNGCFGLSSSVSIHPDLGVGSSVIAAAIRIYPNPVHDRLTVTAPVKVDVIIRDMQGRTILTGTNAAPLDVSALANGMYMILVNDRDGLNLRTEKLFKAD